LCEGRKASRKDGNDREGNREIRKSTPTSMEFLFVSEFS
jgi:hypothetical protein